MGQGLAPGTNNGRAASQGPTSTYAQSPVTADGAVVLARAIDASNRRASVSASLRQRIDLFGQQLFGAGLYLEQATLPRRRFRLELDIQGTRQKQSVTRVSDGRILWLLDDLAGERRLRLVDLRRVEDAIGGSGPPATAVARPMQLALGGLPGLLATWQENFQFDIAESAELQNVDSRIVPVWVLHGRWQATKLQSLLNAAAVDNKDNPAAVPKNVDVRRLPPQIPDAVVLYVGRQDFFPYRFEYQRSRPTAGSAGSDPETIAAMDLFDVRINVPLSQSEQAGLSRPAELPQFDFTEAYLQQLGVPGPRSPGR